jgi:hypothetical protein
MIFLRIGASLSVAQKALSTLVLYYCTAMLTVGTVLPAFAQQISPQVFARQVLESVHEDQVVFVTDLMYELNFYLNGRLEPIAPQSLNHLSDALVIAYEQECNAQESAQILLWSQPLRKHHSSKICLMQIGNEK